MQGAGCIELGPNGEVAGTMAGRTCSFYYLQHATMDLLMNNMTAAMDFKRLLVILASAPEYDELPVRPRAPPPLPPPVVDAWPRWVAFEPS